MSRSKLLPIDETIQLFLDRKLSPADRADAVKMAREAVWSSNAAKLLVAQVSEEAMKQGMSAPTDFMGLTFTYGIAIGILTVQHAQNRRIIMLI